MLRWVVQRSLTFRLLVVVIAAGIVTLGVIRVADAKAETLPEFSPVYIEVQAEALGLSAVEVEQLVTAPLEADLLNGVAFVDEIRSSSIPGLSSVVMVFEPGTTLPHARQLVQERLTQAHALPNVSKPPAMLEPVSSASRVMMIGLSSPSISLIDQSVLARWTIRPKLMGVPGVANVAIFGQRERQLQVLVDPQRLADKGLTLQQVIATSGNAMWVSPLTFLEASTPGTGGFIDTPNQRIGVRHVSPVVDAASLSRVAVEGRPELRLGDVANVVEDHQPLIGNAVTEDAGGLMLVVEKFPDANTVEVTRGIESALHDLRPGLTGLELNTSIYRPAGFIESATRNVAFTVGLGLALAALVIGLFFLAWRTALIAIAVIPVSLAAATVVLLITGAPLNILVVLGVVATLAIVVDDAIADTATTQRELRERHDADEQASASSTPAAVILRSVSRSRTALIYATVIVAVALVPVFVVPGSLGALVAPLAIAYLVAIAAALVVALALTPALCLLLSARPARVSPVLRVLRRGYARVAPVLVRLTWPAAVAVVLLLAFGAALVPALTTSLTPSLKEPNLLIQFEGAAGTSQPEMTRIAAAASAELRTVPGVRDVGAHVGRALLSDRVQNVNAGEIWVNLDPAADHDATVAAVRSVVDGYPGLDRSVSTYLSLRSANLLARPGSEFVVRVYGSDLAVLDGKAEEVRRALARVSGLVDPTVQRKPQDPTLEVTVDLAAAQRFGIKPGDVRRATAALMSGIEVGAIFEAQKVFEVRVWGVPDIRNSFTGLQNLLIDLPGGGQVRLADVAMVRVAPAPSSVDRESVSRYLDVVAGVDGRGRAAVAADAEESLRGLAFPLDYRAEILTGFEDRQGEVWWITGAGVAAAIVIFLLLQAALGRWRLAVLAFLTLPVALAGGLGAAYLGGGVITLGSLAGLVTVLAVATRHMLTLIRHYQELEGDGENFGPALVQRGTGNRLGPILATTVAAAAAMAPFAVTGPVAGLELIAPMAVVVLGGLVTSALLNLLIVPALYLRFAGSLPQTGDDEPSRPAKQSDELLPTGPPVGAPSVGARSVGARSVGTPSA
jgi:Cu/Ag efflux pump CusA